jgi:hypothetical protein
MDIRARCPLRTDRRRRPGRVLVRLATPRRQRHDPHLLRRRPHRGRSEPGGRAEVRDQREVRAVWPLGPSPRLSARHDDPPCLLEARPPRSEMDASRGRQGCRRPGHGRASGTQIHPSCCGESPSGERASCHGTRLRNPVARGQRSVCVVRIRAVGRRLGPVGACGETPARNQGHPGWSGMAGRARLRERRMK